MHPNSKKPCCWSTCIRKPLPSAPRAPNDGVADGECDRRSPDGSNDADSLPAKPAVPPPSSRQTWRNL